MTGDPPTNAPYVKIGDETAQTQSPPPPPPPLPSLGDRQPFLARRDEAATLVTLLPSLLPGLDDCQPLLSLSVAD
jgi:hypothetical protein